MKCFSLILVIGAAAIIITIGTVSTVASHGMILALLPALILVALIALTAQNAGQSPSPSTPVVSTSPSPSLSPLTQGAIVPDSPSLTPSPEQPGEREGILKWWMQSMRMECQSLQRLGTIFPGGTVMPGARM